MSKGFTQDVAGEEAKRSRRELLAGAAVGAAGAIGAVALTKPTTVHAGTDGDVVLGAENNATQTTIILTSNGNAPFIGLDGGSDPTAVGVVGDSLVGVGLFGRSSSGEGVYGQSGSGQSSSTPSRNGIHGVTDSATDSGLWGENLNGGYGVYGSTVTSGISGPTGVLGANMGSGPGVKGQSNSGPGLYGFAPNNTEGLYAQSGSVAGSSPGATRTAVHGVTNSASDSAVWGENVGHGYGVAGSTTSSGASGPPAVIGHNLGSGPGMVGYSDNGGIGVYGTNHGTGVGVRAENTSSGTALQVSGPAVFSRSGLVSIAAGLKSATVTGVAMTAASLVLATVQNNAGVLVAYALPTIPGTSLTITLNKAVPTGKTAKVAWFVVN